MTRQQLISNLVGLDVLKTPAIIQAFQAIDRHHFIPPNLATHAYLNRPLPIGHGQTISQPYTVAFMLEMLQPRAGYTILDIGSGSGWQTALLAHIVGSKGHIHGVEVIPELADQSQINLASYPHLTPRVTFHSQSADTGLSEHAPFDRIVAAAEVADIPTTWLDQLQSPGRLVAPVDNSLVLITKSGESKLSTQKFPGFAFVPFVH